MTSFRLGLKERYFPGLGLRVSICQAILIGCESRVKLNRDDYEERKLEKEDSQMTQLQVSLMINNTFLERGHTSAKSESKHFLVKSTSFSFFSKT